MYIPRRREILQEGGGVGGSSTNESFTWLFRQPLHERAVCDRHVVALHPDPDLPISEMQLTLSTSLPLSAPTNEKAFLFSDRQFQFRHSLLSKEDFNQKMHALDPPSPTTTLESCPHPLGRVCNKIIQYSCQRLLVLLVSVITCRLQKKMESGKQPTAAGPQRLQVSMHVRRACLPPKQLLRRCDSATIQYEWSGWRHVPMFWTGPPTVDISMTSICRR